MRSPAGWYLACWASTGDDREKAYATDSSEVSGSETCVALRVRAMSSRRISIGAMYVVRFLSDHATTWPQTRPVDLSKTHAPESPGAKKELVCVRTLEMWV